MGRNFSMKIGQNGETPVDLHRNRHQSSTMPNRVDARNNLFITRHATQELLRRAFDALPSTTCGLLGGQHAVIRKVYPLSHHHRPAPSALTGHIQALESSGMSLLSLYISSVNHDECMDNLREKALQICPAASVDELARLLELPLAVVRLDTRGRMEVILLDKGDKTELSILLQE